MSDNTVRSVRSGNWDDPGTWSGPLTDHVVVHHAVILIGSDRKIEQKITVVSPGSLRVRGVGIVFESRIEVIGDGTSTAITLEPETCEFVFGAGHTISGPVFHNKRPICPTCGSELTERRRRKKFVQKCRCGYSNVFSVTL